MSCFQRGAISALFLLIWSQAAAAQAPDLAKYPLVDLTHAFNAETVYWPTSPSGFVLKSLFRGKTDAGYFYAANSFCAPEHGGTHLDSPVHFSKDGWSVQDIPLAHLMGPAVVINVTEQAARDRDYRLTQKDVLAFEKKHGRIKAGTLVLLRTGWSRFWPDKKAYLGDDTPGDASKLRFPSYGEAAARLLIEDRDVTLIGVDTASIDYGQSKRFIVHQVAGENDVIGLENLTNLELLPPRGATVIALPMKIQGGTGAPARIIAVLPR